MNRFVLILVYLFYDMNLLQFDGCWVDTDILWDSDKGAVRWGWVGPSKHNCRRIVFIG